MSAAVACCLAAIVALAGPGREWYVHGTDPRVLTHGVRETDDRDFQASCRRGSHSIRVVLSTPVAGLTRTSGVRVHVSVGRHSRRYAASGVMDENAGGLVPAFTLATNDPLLHWMQLGSHVRIAVGHAAPHDVALAGSALPVATFVAGCR